MMSVHNEHTEGQSRRGGCSGSAGRDAVCPPDPTTTLRAQPEQQQNIAAFRGMDRDTPGRDLASHLAASSDSHRIPSQFQADPERHDRGWTNVTIGAQRGADRRTNRCFGTPLRSTSRCMHIEDKFGCCTKQKRLR